jgi:hypothetical protein
MKNQLGGALALAVVCAGTAAAQAPAPMPMAGKGEAVTITGCVLAGTKENSVVLTHVIEGAAAKETPQMWLGAEGMVTPDGASQQQVIYWLNHESIKKMREHIGHRVEIKGEVTDVSTGTVKVDKEPGKDGRDNKVTVDGRGKEAKAKTEGDVGAGPTTAVGEHKVETTTMPLHRIKVDSVRMVAATCP